MDDTVKAVEFEFDVLKPINNLGSYLEGPLNKGDAFSVNSYHLVGFAGFPLDEFCKLLTTGAIKVVSAKPIDIPVSH